MPSDPIGVAATPVHMYSRRSIRTRSDFFLDLQQEFETISVCDDCTSEKGGSDAREETVKVFGPLSGILDVELASKILVPAVSHLLPLAETLALSATCKDVFQGLEKKESGLMIPNLNQESIRLAKRGWIDPLSVTSLEVNSVPDDNPDPPELKTKIFRNCRSLIWKPKNWRNVPRGEFIESESCTIQGVENVYFRLYPRGKEYSRPGRCAMYVGSNGTEMNVSLRLQVGRVSHILTQRLQQGYVDGFVNFCDLHQALVGDDEIVCTLEILSGAFDDKFNDMKVTADDTSTSVTWTIPSLTEKYIQSFSVGDRIISDSFTLDGLGRDTCLVIYPKGDTIDAISTIGNFANVGLFGSGARDATFRLSAGQISKVMTVCPQRYRNKINKGTRSCGEFFDACFGELDQMLTPDDRLNLKIEVIDTIATQTMDIRDGAVYWTLDKIDALAQALGPFEELYSRYFIMAKKRSMDEGDIQPVSSTVADMYFRFSIRFVEEDEVEIKLIGLNDKRDLCVGSMELVLSTGKGAYISERLCFDVKWFGLQNHAVHRVKLLQKRPGNIHVEMKMHNVHHANRRSSQLCRAGTLPPGM